MEQTEELMALQEFPVDGIEGEGIEKILGNGAADCIEIAIKSLEEIMRLEDAPTIGTLAANKAIQIAGNARRAISDKLVEMHRNSAKRNGEETAMNFDYIETQVLERELKKRSNGDLFILPCSGGNSLRIERKCFGFSFAFKVNIFGWQPQVKAILSTDDLIRLEHWLKRALDKNIGDLEG